MQQRHADCVEKHTHNNCPIEYVMFDHVTHFHTPSFVTSKKVLPETFTKETRSLLHNWIEILKQTHGAYYITGLRSSSGEA